MSNARDWEPVDMQNPAHLRLMLIALVRRQGGHVTISSEEVGDGGMIAGRRIVGAGLVELTTRFDDLLVREA